MKNPVQHPFSSHRAPPGPATLHHPPYWNHAYPGYPGRNNFDRVEYRAAHLLKLSGWPPGPLRTVMPEVPVEPVALGAGLGLSAGSVWDSIVALMAKSPCSEEELLGRTQ